jgi:hypothetical protein
MGIKTVVKIAFVGKGGAGTTKLTALCPDRINAFVPAR